MSSYVAFKTNIAVVEPADATKDFLSLELTILISGIKLWHPPTNIFELSCVLYFSYKNREKSCVNGLLETFHEICEFSQLKYADQNILLRQSVNCSERGTHSTSQIKWKWNKKVLNANV